jgi:hypothetical protein
MPPTFSEREKGLTMLKALAEVINAHRPPEADYEVRATDNGWALVHNHSNGAHHLLSLSDMVQLAEVLIQAAAVRAFKGE